MENAPINIKEVYVIFDYKNHIVFSTIGFNRKNYGLDCLPANTREKNIFMEHFFLRGRRKVKFREYKEFDPIFHGTAKFKKKYDQLELNSLQYINFLELMSYPENECKNLSDVLELLFKRSDSLYYDYLVSKEARQLTRLSIKKIFAEINKQIDKL